MSAAMLLLLALAAEAGPASQPLWREKPIVFDEEREQLTRDYRRAVYGQEGVTSVIEPRVVVLHLTGLPTLDESFALYQAPRADPARYPKLSAVHPLGPSVHFLVDRDGTIHRLLEPTTMARHALGLNTRSIAVAFVGERRRDVSDEQIAAAVKLTERLLADYFELSYVVGHHQVHELADTPLWREPAYGRGNDKLDPGDEIVARVRGERFYAVQGEPHEFLDVSVTSDFVYDVAWLRQRSLRELVLLRNEIFARHGGSFDEREWVQRHFEAQPWYGKREDFDEGLLTRLDRRNVVLIANVERDFTQAELDEKKRAARGDAIELALVKELKRMRRLMEPLLAWRPGKDVPAKNLAAVEKNDLLELYARMSMALPLFGFDVGNCELVEESTGLEGVCEVWATRPALDEPPALSKVDARAVAKVEQALARKNVEDRFRVQDPLQNCIRDCSLYEGRLDEEEAPSSQPAGGLAVADLSGRIEACGKQCRADLADTQRYYEQERRAVLRNIERGEHAHGAMLVDEALFGALEGFG